MISLINKQVVCFDPWIPKFMYPTYKWTNDINEINPNESTIFYGNEMHFRWIKENCKRYIIVANTGEVNLKDRMAIFDYTCKVNNYKKPQYLEELLDQWDYETFYENWKRFWVAGFITDEGIESCELIQNILKNVNNPVKLLRDLSNDITKCEDTCITRLISFIDKCRKITSISDNATWRDKAYYKFNKLYGKNFKSSVRNFLDFNISNEHLRLFYLLYDILYGAYQKPELPELNLQYIEPKEE